MAEELLWSVASLTCAVVAIFVSVVFVRVYKACPQAIRKRRTKEPLP